MHSWGRGRHRHAACVDFRMVPGQFTRGFDFDSRHHQNRLIEEDEIY